MEIQGRLEARNIDILSQHGVLYGASLLPPRSVKTSNTCFNLAVAGTCVTQDGSNQHDDNSNHITPGRTSLFRLPMENGSRPGCSQTNTRYVKVAADTTTVGRHDVIMDTEMVASLGTPESLKIPMKAGISRDNSVVGSELGNIEQTEVVLQQQLNFPLPVLRLHHKDGATKLSFVHRPTSSVPGILNLIKDADKSPQNVFFSRSEGVSSPSRDEDCKPLSKWTERSDVFQGGSISAGFCNSADSSNNVDNLKRTDQTLIDFNQSALTNPKDASSHHTAHGSALSNKYDHSCDQGPTENTVDMVVPQSRVDESSTSIPVSVGFVETIDTSDVNFHTLGLQDVSNSATESSCHPAREPFSGTIAINNQSLIVTIENGSLTLTSPPGGFVQREEDIIKIKEHLVLTDHKDIVVLNYDNSAKSIGAISSLAVAASSYQKGPQSGLLVSDTELAHIEDCSLSELSTSLEPDPTVKKEAEVLSTVVDSDVVPSSPRTEDCGRERFRPLSLPKSKRENVPSYSCPEPGCSSIFITRQKLKIHLLNHTEDPRPYQCSVDGCGWAFTTSYKLKRHLQSHNKQRPHICQFEGCGRSFTTVYNLKAHVKVHEQDNAFICEICSERFRSATRLTNHQRIHFEPHRPHKCEFPDCGKTFITFSALFSHNRTHFRETGQFLCNYPGCGKTYDKACRLKIHLRSHTGERPFVCDSEGCGWSFTSMSKLLRHKRKHEDDRRFVCTEEGCGKSFTRAEHLKGHSITHLGTKPFHCHAEGCSAKFSARSSLYIHSKKHKQDADLLRSRCPLTNCFKHFSSRSNLKSHMMKHHQLNADILNQIETQSTLTPSSELISSPQMSSVGHGMTGVDQLPSLDLGSMLSAVPEGTVCTTGVNNSSSTFTMDLSLVSPSILTIDPSSVGTSNGPSMTNSFTKLADPLILAASADIRPVSNVISSKGTLNLDDMAASPRAPRSLTTLTTHDYAVSLDPSLEHQLTSSNSMTQEGSTSLTNVPVPELLGLPSKVVEFGGLAGAGTMLGCVEVLGAQEAGKVLTQLVCPSTNFSPKKDNTNSVSPSSFLEIVGSARTDYRAFQLAKRKKQRPPLSPSGAGNQGKIKVGKTTVASTVLTTSMVRYDDVARTASDGMTLRDSTSGTQYVQIQLLQDDPATDGDLAFQLSSQPSSSHSQLTVDLPVNILQENSVIPEDDNGSDNSQFTGSTINLQDLV